MTNKSIKENIDILIASVKDNLIDEIKIIAGDAKTDPGLSEVYLEPQKVLNSVFVELCEHRAHVNSIELNSMFDNEDPHDNYKEALAAFNRAVKYIK